MEECEAVSRKSRLLAGKFQVAPGVYKRFPMIMLLTFSVISLTFFSAISSRISGGDTITSTLAGFIVRLPFGIIFIDPLMVTGTMGTFAFRAILRLPDLNCPTVPSILRVPSGNITIEWPSFNLSTAWFKAFNDCRASPLSINTQPIYLIQRLKTGTLKNSTLEIKPLSLGTNPINMGMSKLL